MKSDYLVCYDIADERRLSRVYQFMKGRGLHLQYSVFYCRLTWNELVRIEESLCSIIDEKEDDVRIYPLPSGWKVVVLGCGDRLPEGADIYI
jgi:CRISPR-associated protein Cas2